MFDAVLMGWSNATHGTIHLQTDRRRVIWSGFNLYLKRSESASIYYDNHPKHGWHTTNLVNIQGLVGLVDNHQKHVDQFCFVIICTYGNKKRRALETTHSHPLVPEATASCPDSSPLCAVVPAWNLATRLGIDDSTGNQLLNVEGFLHMLPASSQFRRLAIPYVKRKEK